MATTKKKTEKAESLNPRAWYLLLGLIGIMGFAGVIYYLTRPPQMGTSKEVFRTVDALYTAIRNQDEKRLFECELRLETYHAEGKLPSNAAHTLHSMIQTAKAGRWQSAAESLYYFMLAQRRDGVIESSPPKKAKPKAVK